MLWSLSSFWAQSLGGKAWLRHEVVPQVNVEFRVASDLLIRKSTVQLMPVHMKKQYRTTLHIYNVPPKPKFFLLNAVLCFVSTSHTKSVPWYTSSTSSARQPYHPSPAQATPSPSSASPSPPHSTSRPPRSSVSAPPATPTPRSPPP